MLDVKRVSERLMVVKVIVSKSVLNLISVHAPVRRDGQLGGKRGVPDHVGGSIVSGIPFW